jgi:hypothetical protein
MQGSPPQCKSLPYKWSVYKRVGRNAGAKNFRWASKRQIVYMLENSHAS